jgi:hypothetical protein
MGVLGLFLMLVVARLTASAYYGPPTTVGRVRGFAARRLIDAVAVVGWLFDRLPSHPPVAHQRNCWEGV